MSLVQQWSCVYLFDYQASIAVSNKDEMTLTLLIKQYISLQCKKDYAFTDIFSFLNFSEFL